MPADYVYKKKDGNTIDCYGKIHEDSNFAVVCENELYDGIAADIDGDKYNTWKKAIESGVIPRLQKHRLNQTLEQSI